MTNSPPPPAPPPGWYPDAQGRQRWWDGSAWTSHITPQTPRRPTVRLGEGSFVGSIIAGVFCAVIAPTALIMGVVAASTGQIPRAVAGIVTFLAVVAFAVVAFANAAALSRRRRGTRAP